MAGNKKPGKKDIEQYEHKDKSRLNNPPVGLVARASGLRQSNLQAGCLHHNF